MDTIPTKLVIAVVQIEDIHGLVERLIAEQFGVTRIDAAGGFLRRESAVAIVATDDERVPALLESVRQTCRRRVVVWFPPFDDGVMALPGQPIDVEVGGAVIFVVPIERVEFLSRVNAIANRQPTNAPMRETREAAAVGS